MVYQLPHREPTVKDEVLEFIDLMEISLFGAGKSRGPLQIEGIAAEHNIHTAFDNKKRDNIRDEISEIERMLNSQLVDSLDNLRNLIRTRKRGYSENVNERKEANYYFHEVRKYLNIVLKNAKEILTSSGLIHYAKFFEELRESVITILDKAQGKVNSPITLVYNN